MRRIKITALIMALCISFSVAVSCKEEKKEEDTSSPAKIRQNYIDHLNEKYADYTEVEYGLDITKKTDIVSICYSTWFNVVLGNNKIKIFDTIRQGVVFYNSKQPFSKIIFHPYLQKFLQTQRLYQQSN